VTKIVDIEGVGTKQSEALAAAGIRTVERLLKEGATPAGRKDVAARTKISDAKILEWVNRADLFRIKGVGSEFSDLLEQAGVDTVKELATRRPENLHAKMLEVNVAKKLVRRPPTLKDVQKWVAEAKTLKPAISY
jgi:predicted flap endonuclease-1-like 5' DNA nuclease